MIFNMEDTFNLSSDLIMKKPLFSQIWAQQLSLSKIKVLECLKEKSNERMKTSVQIMTAVGLAPSKTEIHVYLLIENGDLFSSLGMVSKTLWVGLSQQGLKIYTS